MKKFIADINKFSFAQLTSNSDGKTSGSGTAGIYIVFIGGLCFLLGCIDKMFLDNNIDILTQSIIFVTIGATLLGYRKSKSSVDVRSTDESQDNIEDKDEEYTEEKPLNS